MHPQLLSFSGFFIGALLIYVLGVNVFFWDEWDLHSWFQTWQSSQSHLELLQTSWKPHNEHRLTAMLWTYGLWLELQLEDLRWVMLAGQGMLWGGFALLLHRIRNYHTSTLLLLWLFCVSPIHHTNIFWAFQIQWYWLWFGLVLCFLSLSTPQFRLKSLVGMLLGGSVAILGTSASVMVLISSSLILGIRAFQEKALRVYAAVWGLFVVSSLSWYLQGLKSTNSLSATLKPENFVEMGTYFFTLMGSVVGADDVGSSMLMTCVGMLSLIGYVWKNRYQLFTQDNYLGWTFVIYGLSIGLMITLGRWSMGSNSALSSHYVLSTMSFWVGLVLLWKPRVDQKRWLWGVLLLACLATMNKKYPEMLREHHNRVRGKACYHEVLKKGAASENECQLLYPSAHVVMERAALWKNWGVEL